MKQTWMTMIFAASLTSGAAMAQGLKGTVPFDFTAGGKQMPAGTYSVSRVEGIGNSYTLSIRNLETKGGALLVSTIALDNNSPRTGNGTLVFKCNSSGCALAQVHTPGESRGRAFPTPATNRGDAERTVAIRLGAFGSTAGF